MNKSSATWRSNMLCARRIWGQVSATAIDALKQLTKHLAVSVAAGDLQFFENHWYVTHSGLLRIAQRRKCRGIETAIQDHLSDPQNNKWVIKAIVFKSRYSKGFAGYGDADPSNVSSLVRGAELRIAETRAVNRALRKAYGIGLCSLEELPPWRLSPAQIPVLRRTLQSRPAFPKGVTRANENPRSQSGQRKKVSGRRGVPSPGGALRTRRPRS